MSILRQLAWSAFRRAAADPKIQRKAINTARIVDKKMNDTADKVVSVAAKTDPMREAGRAFGKLMSNRNDKR